MANRRKETDPTGTSLQRLLPKVLEEISKAQQLRPDLILAAWPEVIGAKLAPMTQAFSFESGVLYVKVKNASLNSVLVQEKFKLLKGLQEKFPRVEIRNIIFRIV